MLINKCNKELFYCSYYCVMFAESEPYCHSGMFVWMSVGQHRPR